MVRLRATSSLGIWLAICCLSGLCAAPVGAAGGAERPDNELKVKVELIADVSAIVPGRPFQVGLRQSIAPRWHTY